MLLTPQDGDPGLFDFRDEANNQGVSAVASFSSSFAPGVAVAPSSFSFTGSASVLFLSSSSEERGLELGATLPSSTND